MKTLFAVAVLATAAVTGIASAATLSGAGATFPAPVYAKWAEAYKAQTGTALNYQAIGSGGGIKQINANTVDFGASDKPLKPDALAAGGLQLFPSVIGGVVPVVNLPGIHRAASSLLASCCRTSVAGFHQVWNVRPIRPTRRGSHSHLPITVVHRSDGSGPMFLLTSYLSLEAPGWAAGPGANDAVNWPVGIGGKGNDGVAAFVKQTPGRLAIWNMPTQSRAG